jgi:hypothetical protein
MDDLDKAMTELAASIHTWAQTVLILLSVTAVVSVLSLVVVLFAAYHQLKTREATERLVQLEEHRQKGDS